MNGGHFCETSDENRCNSIALGSHATICTRTAVRHSLCWFNRCQVRDILMRFLFRATSVLAAFSVVSTVQLVVALAIHGQLGAILTRNALGALTVTGWIICLTVGPVAVIQLWRYRNSGRQAGMVLFGYTVAYYLAGIEAHGSQTPVLFSTAIAALPLCVLVSKPARTLCDRRAMQHATVV